jgi:hypothetical protein
MRDYHVSDAKATGLIPVESIGFSSEKRPNDVPEGKNYYVGF